MNTEEFTKTLPKPTKTDAEIRAYEFANNIVPRLKATGWKNMDRFLHRIEHWNCKPQEGTFKKVKTLCVDLGAVVALIGIRGTGKTTIAAQVAIERAELWWAWGSQQPAERTGRPPQGFAHYRKLTDLLAAFKSIYSDFGSIDAERVMEARDQLCTQIDLLVIDEVHDCDEQRLKDRLLTDLIDRRYAARKDTILISNQNQQEFQATTSDSILSRLTEHGQIIDCKWTSFREKH